MPSAEAVDKAVATSIGGLHLWEPVRRGVLAEVRRDVADFGRPIPEKTSETERRADRRLGLVRQ